MRTAAIAALFGLLGSVLGISVLGSIQAHAGNRTARQNYQTAGGGATFTGGIVPDATTFQSAVTMDSTLSVGLNLTVTGRIDANNGIKLGSGEDLTCQSPNSCEIGAAANFIQRVTVNQIDVTILRARVSGAALDAAELDGLIISHEESAAPTQPHACSVAADFGLIQIVNDNDDTLVSGVCYCGQLADDSTYDWLDIKDNTACPFF